MEIILGKTAGFCYGVKRAVEGATKELENKVGNIYCLGEIVHNEHVVNELKNKGLKFIEKIEEAEGKTIIRAHGIPKNVYKEAEERKIELCDYTCPNVLKIHELVEKYTKDKYFIFICGNKNHPETIGTIGFCKNNYSIIESLDDIEKAIDDFENSNYNKILLISQTTYHLEKFLEIEKQIRSRISGKTPIKIENTICKATQLRQIETKKVAQQVEYMVIIGGKNSSNTKKLYEVAKENCKQVICIQTKDEIDVEELKNYKTIGIMAGASTPAKIINDVIERIENNNILI